MNVLAVFDFDVRVRCATMRFPNLIQPRACFISLSSQHNSVVTVAATGAEMSITFGSHATGDYDLSSVESSNSAQGHNM